MDKRQKLVLERAIFVLIISIAFGVIIITEKMGSILIPKATKKINNYIEEKYNKDDFILSDVTFKNTTYTMKVTSKKNPHHYFYINYYARKMTDTYKKDYIEGKNLLNYLKKELKKEIMKKTATSCDIEITSTLDKYTNTVKERIIKEDNLLELKFYNIKKELLIDNWNEDNIVNIINSFIDNYKENNITPKSYKIIITNKSDITESIEIKNITNNINKEIIHDIINDNKSDLLIKNKITYKYLN